MSDPLPYIGPNTAVRVMYEVGQGFQAIEGRIEGFYKGEGPIKIGLQLNSMIIPANRIIAVETLVR